ncbi:hypothetical protein [Hahella ganghwensis]|uniref:hypothetical protein n=1 Tax=Hahella ganghwensis TaxID=286420 RepID=UPI0003792F67|nr:hypothetical protein [Hahella ganghwensis]
MNLMKKLRGRYLPLLMTLITLALFFWPFFRGCRAAFSRKYYNIREEYSAWASTLVVCSLVLLAGEEE